MIWPNGKTHTGGSSVCWSCMRPQDRDVGESVCSSAGAGTWDTIQALHFVSIRPYPRGPIG